MNMILDGVTGKELQEIVSRITGMCEIARQIQSMVRNFGRRNDISITYGKLTDKTIGKFSDWNRKYFHLMTGEEYFFMWENTTEESSVTSSLLYVVCVTGDSLLTAAGELMSLVSKKF